MVRSDLLKPQLDARLKLLAGHRSQLQRIVAERAADLLRAMLLVLEVLECVHDVRPETECLFAMRLIKSAAAKEEDQLSMLAISFKLLEIDDGGFLGGIEFGGGDTVVVSKPFRDKLTQQLFGWLAKQL